MKSSQHREGTSWRNVLSSGHHALREGANFGTIQKEVRKTGRNARCVLSLKELAGGGHRRNEGRQGQGWKETIICFLSALNKREQGYLAVNEIYIRPNSGSQIMLSLLSSGLTWAGVWGSQRMRWFAVTQSAISPSTHNLPGTGGTLVEKAAAPKPCYWRAPGRVVEVCPHARPLLCVNWRSGPPPLLWKTTRKRWSRWGNGVTRPGRRAHGSPLIHGSQADSTCQHCSPARPLGCGAGAGAGGGALPPAMGGRGPGRRRREDGALLPPGGRDPGGTSEVPGQRARGRWEPARLPSGDAGSPGGRRQGSGDGRGQGPAAVSRGLCWWSALLLPIKLPLASSTRSCAAPRPAAHMFVENFTFWLCKGGRGESERHIWSIDSCSVAKVQQKLEV